MCFQLTKLNQKLLKIDLDAKKYSNLVYLETMTYQF